MVEVRRQTDLRRDREDFLFEPEGLVSVDSAAGDLFHSGQSGVESLYETRDRKAELIHFAAGEVLVNVKSEMGYPALYPLHPARIEKPVEALLMDLDGTSVHSEPFWIWIVEQTTARLLDNPEFSLEDADLPYVAGHSVSEHLSYCINKYCPGKKVEEARDYYFEITRREMRAILEGRGRMDAFVPTEGLKDFLLRLKDSGVKIALVTSGLYEKAWPEIYAAFQQMDLGDPKEFYDAIITAGYPLRKGEVGTLGELEPKPHPWLYAEAARVGLGIPFERRHRVVGLEDSGAGIVSIRLAGFAAAGFRGGNIDQSGTRSLCNLFCQSFEEVLHAIV